jgi:ABC-type Mn2+/Zn2+ transport system ATPase subunit
MKLVAQVLPLNPLMKLRIEHDYPIDQNGKIMGVFGKSGCGKTSLLEYLFREFRKKEQVAYMKQDILLPPELTVYETLWFYTRLRCPEECSSIGLVLEKMNMSSLSDTKVKSLSGGEKKRVMFAYHLLDERSHYFLLDEPFSGIDPINTELIFFLMREKTIHRPCTILMTIHQIHPLIQQQLDEIWTFVPSSHLHCFQLEITPKSSTSIMEEEDTFSDISLNDFSSSPPKKIFHPSTCFSQWKDLFLRDRLMDRRNRCLVFLRWTTPLSVVFLQKLIMGSFLQYFSQWASHHEIADLFKTFLLYNILLFTASITPMHMLNDHFHRRLLTYHEISQCLYRKNIYFLNAILWDQFTLLLISLCIVLLLMPPSLLFSSLFFNITISMNFTNMLMWACSSFSRSTFNMTLIFVTTYISIAFIGNMGFFLQNPFVHWIQYTSMIHLQNNLFLEKLFLLLPDQSKSLQWMSSFLNQHPRHSYGEWLGMSVGLWWITPLLIIFMLFFSKFE